jgi:hypothetical protein
MSPAGLRSENDCASEAQQQLQTTEQSSRQRGCYIWTMIASVLLKKLLVVSLMGLGAKKN